VSSRVSLPRAERPRVSIVIVTFGAWALARRALEALRDRTPVPFEVVVVDNPTPEDVAGRLREEVEGVEVIENDQNEGFGPAANRGAERARGALVLFLNSDTVVQEGWIEPLIDALEELPGAGAAVPMLLNEDGTVQEAGGLLFREGWTLMYGFGKDPADPSIRFRRRIDYGSAACLLLRRSEFLDLGGFDPAFVPAYCEDVDLQLRLRRLGRDVVYEPRSRVVHIRFGSSGLDEGVAARLVRRNTALIRERWPDILARRPALVEVPEHAHRVFAARDAEALERILVIGESPPPKILEALLRRHPGGRLTLVATAPMTEEEREPLLLDGIEAVGPLDDPEPWFRERLFHYTAILAVDGSVEEGLAEQLAQTQPEAPLLRVGQDPAEAMRALDEAGIMAEGDARAAGAPHRIG
jgi:GT2 family glycosyltransferase